MVSKLMLVLSLFPGIGLLDRAFEEEGFTVREKLHAVVNGVPLPMGRAIARAVTRALHREG